MFAFLLTLLIIDAIILSVAVLLQAGQGGGLASLGGGTTDTVLGGRQTVTILTKMTWWCGGIFLALALVLSLVRRGGPAASDIQQRIRGAAPLPATQNAPLPITNTPAAPAAGDSGGGQTPAPTSPPPAPAQPNR